MRAVYIVLVCAVLGWLLVPAWRAERPSDNGRPHTAQTAISGSSGSSRQPDEPSAAEVRAAADFEALQDGILAALTADPADQFLLPTLEPPAKLALEAADTVAAAATNAAEQWPANSAARRAGRAAMATAACARAAVALGSGASAEDVSKAATTAAGAHAAAAAAAVQRGRPWSVHVAAAAAEVALAAREAADKRQWAVPLAVTKAVTAVNQAGSAEHPRGAAGGAGTGMLAPGASLRGEDVVYVTFTTVGRHVVATSSRIWRKPLGIRAVILTNANATEFSQAELDEYKEVWGFYPDAPDRVGTVTYYQGDYRAAMAPLLAHRTLEGQYKWIIYGDDDTVFFPEGIARALETHRLDADMPHFVSDSQWGFGIDADHTGPPEWNPRCVPCNFDSQGQNTSSVPVPPLRGCPCTTAAMCEHWQAHLPGKVFHSCDEASLQRPSPSWLGIHGDAGALFSVGLMRQLDFADFEACLFNITNIAGGDNKISHCIWAAGFGLTDPGYSYLSGNLLEHYIFGRYSGRMGGGADSLTKLIQERLLAWRNTGFCAPGADAAKQLCLVPDKIDELVVSMVSTHAYARGSSTLGQVASAMRLLSSVYRMYMDQLHEVYPEVWKIDLVIGAGSPESLLASNTSAQPAAN